MAGQRRRSGVSDEAQHKMGLETRNGRGAYYTRTKRVGGKVVREYVASGELALLIASLEADQRTADGLRKQAEQDELDRARSVEDTLDTICQIGDTVAQAVLLSAGYHRHHAGEWRKRRERPSRKDTR